MKFSLTTLRVKDLEESIKFYTDVIGLEVVRKIGGPGVDIAFLNDGDTKIELICDHDQRDTVVGNDISWGFEVDSLDKTLALIKEKGIEVDAGPIQPNPHVRFFFIRDPNGMRIQLLENIS